VVIDPPHPCRANDTPNALASCTLDSAKEAVMYIGGGLLVLILIIVLLIILL
jgi:hypothetical protein